MKLSFLPIESVNIIGAYKHWKPPCSFFFSFYIFFTIYKFTIKFAFDDIANFF